MYDRGKPEDDEGPRRGPVALIRWWHWVVAVLIVVGIGTLAATVWWSPSTNVPVPVPTGIGARNADWEKNHEPDPNFAPGSAYHLDPSLVAARGDPAFSGRYYLVNHSGGRVQSYEMRFAPGTSLGEAIDQTLAEFPADVHWDWFRAVPASGSAGACAHGQVSSATLTSELNQGPTAGLVEYSSGKAANSYNPPDRPVARCGYLDDPVSTASLTLVPPTSPRRSGGSRRPGG